MQLEERTTLEPRDWPCLRRRAVQEEIVAWVRRRSSAFSRGRSRFRGVSGQQGRWEARIGTFAGRKNARPVAVCWRLLPATSAACQAC